MEEMMINDVQEIVENTDAEKVSEMYENFPIEEVGDGDLKDKLVKGGIFAAGAAAGALTTKVVIPAGKKAFGWVKGKFTKKKKSEEEEVKDESAEEEKENKDPAERGREVL